MFLFSELCQEVRAVAARRVGVAAVREVVELREAILEVVRAQVIAEAAAEARLPSTNTDSTSET